MTELNIIESIQDVFEISAQNDILELDVTDALIFQKVEGNKLQLRKVFINQTGLFITYLFYGMNDVVYHNYVTQLTIHKIRDYCGRMMKPVDHTPEWQSWSLQVLTRPDISTYEGVWNFISVYEALKEYVNSNKTNYIKLIKDRLVKTHKLALNILYPTDESAFEDLVVGVSTELKNDNAQQVIQDIIVASRKRRCTKQYVSISDYIKSNPCNEDTTMYLKTLFT